MPDHTYSLASSAAHPDIEWRRIRATLRMPGLAIAQIESAMKDSGESFDVLAHSFTALSGNVQVMAELIADSRLSCPHEWAGMRYCARAQQTGDAVELF